MHVRLAKEWKDLQTALNDSEFISLDEYIEALSEIAEDVVMRLEAARVDREAKDHKD